MTDPMRIAVFGATGKTGGCVVDEARRRGHAVVAVVRPASADSARFETDVETRVCDVHAGSGVGDAIAGCDAVVSCLGIRRRNPLNPWSPLRSPADTTERSTRHIVEAMRGAGISKIACVSAAGVGESRARASAAIRVLIARSNLGPAYRDLDAMEGVLADSGLAWLALRPTTLTNGRGAGYALTTRYGLTSRIARRAVAAALLDFVTGAETGDQTASQLGEGGRVMVSGARRGA